MHYQIDNPVDSLDPEYQRTITDGGGTPFVPKTGLPEHAPEGLQNRVQGSHALRGESRCETSLSCPPAQEGRHVTVVADCRSDDVRPVICPPQDCVAGRRFVAGEKT